MPRRPSPAWVGVALVTAAVISSCGGDPYTDHEPTAKVKGAGPRPEVSFTASLTEQARSLHVSYRIVNNGHAPLVIYNGAPVGRASATSPLVPQAYVTARKDGTVEIAKRTFTVPPGVHPYTLSYLRGTILAPGQAVADAFDVALPLTPGRPYLSSTELHLPDPVERVVFCLGVVRQDVLPERIRGGVPSRAGGAGPMFPHPSPQHLFCSAERQLR